MSLRKISIFLVLTLLTLWLGVWHDRYRPVGPQLLPALSLKGEGWRLRGDAGTLVQEARGLVRLHSEDPQKSVGLEFRIDEPGRYHYLRLSGELKTSQVVGGEQGWQKARLLLSSHDAAGKWLPLHHHVVTLVGDNDWREYTEVFTVAPQARQLRVAVQLPRATGTLWARNLRLQEVELAPLYLYGRRALALFWGGFLLRLLWPYFRKGQSWVWRAGLGATVLTTFTGILMPGNLKIQLLAKLKKGLHCLRSLWTDKVASIPTPWNGDEIPGIELVAWFDVTKLGHFLLFALLAAVLLTLEPGGRWRRVFFDLLLVAAASELLQLFVHGRSPLVTDWLIDGAGGVLGICLCVAAKTFFAGRALADAADRQRGDD